jgi:two-component system, cell cycle response regulator DivK
MSGDREKALEAGCDEYESKPINFPVLFEKVDALLAAGGSAADATGHADPA